MHSSSPSASSPPLERGRSGLVGKGSQMSPCSPNCSTSSRQNTLLTTRYAYHNPKCTLHNPQNLFPTRQGNSMFPSALAKTSGLSRFVSCGPLGTLQTESLRSSPACGGAAHAYRSVLPAPESPPGTQWFFKAHHHAMSHLCSKSHNGSGRQGLKYVALASLLFSVDQAGCNLTATCQPLPSECWD
jgi:hypothetical protein